MTNWNTWEAAKIKGDGDGLEFLPPMRDGEKPVARLILSQTKLQDQISIRQGADGVFHIVDEHGDIDFTMPPTTAMPAIKKEALRQLNAWTDDDSEKLTEVELHMVVAVVTFKHASGDVHQETVYANVSADGVVDSADDAVREAQINYGMWTSRDGDPIVEEEVAMVQ